MKINTDNNKVYKLIFIVLIVIQVGIIVFYGTRRENLYWDEYFSFETINYYYDWAGDEHYIVDDVNFKFNKWLNNDWAYETIVVDEKDTITNKTFWYVGRKPFLITPYFAFLNVLQGIFTVGRISIWPAICVNIVFFVLAQIVLNSIANKVTESKEMSLICNAIYGFASLTISMGIFVRAYMWVTFAITFVLWCHLKHWEEESIGKTILYELLALFFTYEAYLDAQFTIVWYAILFVVYSVALALTKQYKKICLYSLPSAVVGIVYIFCFSSYIDVLMNLRDVLALGGTTAMSAMLNYVYQMRPIDIVKRPIDMFVTTSNRMFGSWMVVLLGIILFGLGILKNLNRKKHECEKKEVYYDSHIKKFGIVILFTSLFCSIFSTYMCLYVTTRYISYFFPQFALAIVLVSMKLWKSRNNRVLYVGFVAVVSVGFIISLLTSQVDFIYKGDAKAIRDIRLDECKNYMTFYPRGMSDPNDTYELIYIAGQGNNAEIYACNLEEPVIEELRDEMIVSINSGYEPDVDRLELFLTENGYKYELMDRTYRHYYYKATKM